MTVSLGGIVLSDHLQLSIDAAAVGISQRRLIGGASVVQIDAAAGGRSMRLQSKRHMTIVQLDKIKAMQSAGMPVELVHHRGAFQVVITDTTAMEEDFYRADPDTDQTLTVSGTITLLEVS